MKPVISICLCCWNDLEYLKILLKSIEANTKIPTEVCIYDNGSSDGTVEWFLRRLSEAGTSKTIFCNFEHGKTNEGCSAVNYAVKMARGKYIIDINSDMYVLPGYDETIVSLLEKYPDCSVSVSNITPSSFYPKQSMPVINNCGNTPESIDHAKLLEFHKKIALRKNLIIDFMHPIAMTRELWDRVGGIDKDYTMNYGSDWQLAYDIYKHGGKTLSCTDPLIYHFGNRTLGRIEKKTELCQRGMNLFNKKTKLTIETFNKQINRWHKYG